jgi:large subunit ribosomal protein L6
MSRIAKSPIGIPSGVDVAIDGQTVNVKGSKGSLSHNLHASVEIRNEDGTLLFAARENTKPAVAQAGTARALVNNMVTGVSQGFERKLTLVGVGYRAQMQGTSLNLALGFSHPVEFPVPEGLSIVTPSQTEIVISGIDKQKVGQAAAVIRNFRPPEPYKGKGVRYSDEQVVRKEAKKK